MNKKSQLVIIAVIIIIIIILALLAAVALFGYSSISVGSMRGPGGGSEGSYSGPPEKSSGVFGFIKDLFSIG